MRIDSQKISKAISQSAKSLLAVMPALIATVLIIALSLAIIPSSLYISWLRSGGFVSGLLAAIVGSISVGNPMISYIISGELLSEGVSLTIVTIFIVSWVTVGIVQIPAESLILGRKFAILRNITSFILVFFVSFLTAFFMGALV